MSQPEVDPARTPIGIAGTGRIGQALGRLLIERGEPVAAIAGRDAARTAAAAAFLGGGTKPLDYSRLPAHALRLLIAVPDDAVTDVARTLAAAGMRAGLALQTCGALGPEALAPLAAQGVSCATFHPLQTVASPERGLAALPGSAFAVSGDAPAVEWAERIVALLGGHVLRIPPDQWPLYHVAAVMASNYIVGLIAASVELLRSAGIDEPQALRAIAPLARAALDNALELGPAAALTGPIERGDCETVASHLAALSAAPHSVGQLYRRAGLHVVELARRKSPGASLAKIEAMLRGE